MARFFRQLFKFVASLALLWLSMMLIVIGFRLCIPLRISGNGLVVASALIVGLLLFGKQKFTPLYIFGH